MKTTCWLTLFLVFLASSASSQSDGHHSDEILREVFEVQVRELASSVDGVLGLVIQDLVSGNSIRIHADTVLAQASVIKLSILVELYRQALEGKLSLLGPVAIEASDLAPGSGVLQHLTPGVLTMSLRDVAVLMVVVSDNSATNLLIDRVGMESVNRTMDELGLSHTRLSRKMMDAEAWAEDRENLSTPNETALLLEKIYRNEILDAESCEAILEILSIPKSSRIRALLPRGTRVAHKTGTLNGVVNDAGIVYVEGRPFIMVAMTNWVKDAAAAGKAMSDIALLAFHFFDRIGNSNTYGHRK